MINIFSLFFFMFIITIVVIINCLLLMLKEMFHTGKAHVYETSNKDYDESSQVGRDASGLGW